jgi:hypothetical protein
MSCRRVATQGHIRFLAVQVSIILLKMVGNTIFKLGFQFGIKIYYNHKLFFNEKKKVVRLIAQCHWRPSSISNMHR